MVKRVVIWSQLRFHDDMAKKKSSNDKKNVVGSTCFTFRVQEKIRSLNWYQSKVKRTVLVMFPY